MLRTVSLRSSTIAIVCLLAALVPFAAAQVTTTGIHGMVKDSSGAVVPNVTLTLTDTATKAEKATHSEADGGFVFANILAGTYQLTVSSLEPAKITCGSQKTGVTHGFSSRGKNGNKVFRI
jgi:hypothetical protein